MICHFRDQNGQIFMKIFFWYKPLSLLSSTYWPFSLCKIEKKNLTKSQNLKIYFWAQNGPLSPIFFLKIIKIILIYLLASFIM